MSFCLYFDFDYFVCVQYFLSGSKNKKHSKIPNGQYDQSLNNIEWTILFVEFPNVLKIFSVFVFYSKYFGIFGKKTTTKLIRFNVIQRSKYKRSQKQNNRKRFDTRVWHFFHSTVVVGCRYDNACNTVVIFRAIFLLLLTYFFFWIEYVFIWFYFVFSLTHTNSHSLSFFQIFFALVLFFFLFLTPILGSCEFTERDIEVFRRYLTFCGIGIQNAQLFEMSVQEYRRNQILLNLARSIFEEQNNLECLVTKILTEARELLKVKRCAVFLLDLDCCESVSTTLRIPTKNK